MKLLTEKHKQYLLRRSKKLLRRRLARKNLTHIPFCTEYLTAPVVLDLDEEETLRFFEKIRQVANDKRQSIKVDFKHLKSISPSCALVLASEMHRFLMIRNNKTKFRVFDFDKWDHNIKILFRDMGMFDLLKVNNIASTFLAEASLSQGTRYIPFITNNNVYGPDAVSLRQQLTNLIRQEVPDHTKLQNGLIEAMTNVVHHAYPVDFQSKSKLKEQPWWMTASFDSNNNRLNIIFFDHGLGIPKSLPKTNVEYVKSLLALIDNDAEMIRAATQIGRTSTKARHRGKGLPQIIEYGQYSEGSTVAIRSNKGVYILTKKDGHQADKVYNVPKALQGSLIEWQINL